MSTEPTPDADCSGDEPHVAEYEMSSPMKEALAKRKNRRTSLPGLVEDPEESEDLADLSDAEAPTASAAGKNTAPAGPNKKASSKMVHTNSRALPLSKTAVPQTFPPAIKETTSSSSSGDSSKVPMLLRRGSKMLTNSLAEFNQQKMKKRRMRRLSLKQSIGTQPVELKDLLLPTSKTRTYWEMFVALILLFQLVYSPYAVAFQTFPIRHERGIYPTAWIARLILDCFVDFICIGDMTIRWRSYYFNAKGDLVQDSTLLRRRYLHSSKLSFSFPLDLVIVLSLPSEAVVLAASGGNIWLAWWTVRWLPLLRFPRMLSSASMVVRASMTLFNISPNVRFACCGIFVIFCRLIQLLCRFLQWLGLWDCLDCSCYVPTGLLACSTHSTLL